MRRQMPLTASNAFRWSALLGFLGVALGAFGAHALKPDLEARHMAAVWEKAVFYHLLHAAVMLLAASLRPFSRAVWGLFGAGVLLFSGSLYAMALTNAHWVVFLTPLGGLCFLAGWLWLAWLGKGRVANEEDGNSGPKGT